MRRLAAACALATAGCGGAAPPPAPAGPATIAELAPATPVLLGQARPVKALQVLSAAERVPDDEQILSKLALAAVAAEVRLVTGGVDVETESARCSVRVAGLPPDVPDARVAPEVERHGLSPDDAQRLAAATGATTIECRADENLPAYTAVPAAEAVAEVVATLVDGTIHDPQTGRYWPREAWRAARQGRRDFDVHRSVAVLRGRADGGRTWLATQGLVAFGRPDLALFPVRADAADAAAAKLLVVADLTIRGEPLGDGSRLALGPTPTLLWAADAYAATLPDGQPRPEAAGPTAGRLALVDPGAKPGDLAGLDAFVGRLVRQ